MIETAHPMKKYPPHAAIGDRGDRAKKTPATATGSARPQRNDVVVPRIRNWLTKYAEHRRDL
jgi:hypothetical protein